MSGRLRVLLDNYLVSHDVEGHTPATIEDYRKNVGYFIAWLETEGHSLELRDVTVFHVMQYLQAKKQVGASPRYMRSIYQHLNTFFRWCVFVGAAPEAPTARMKPPKVPRAYKDYLTRDQIDRLLYRCPQNTFEGARRHALVTLLLSAGLRSDECAGLQRDDLKYGARGHVHVRLGKGQKERYAVFRRTGAVMAIQAGIPAPVVEAWYGWDDYRMLAHYVSGMKRQQGAAGYEDYDPLGG